MFVTIGSLQPFGVASGEVNVIHRHKLAIPKMFPNRLFFGYMLNLMYIDALTLIRDEFRWLSLVVNSTDLLI